MGFLGVWDLFIGALSVGLAAPVIKRLVDSQLPTKWLVIMTTVFDDTDALLTSCVEQGLIKEPLAALFHSQIESLRQRALVTRLRALGAKDYYEDIKNMCGGLSFRIREVCNDVRGLRAEISVCRPRIVLYRGRASNKASKRRLASAKKNGSRLSNATPVAFRLLQTMTPVPPN
ncbi:hypothetical protein BD413DRAFT_542506 [Trametes elegans]|nr:hypothetical protein BD413DRAFT_542506 [Trametes elegans]